MVDTTAMTGTFGALYLAGAAATATTGTLAWRRRRASTAAVALVIYMASLTGTCLTEFVVMLSNSGSLPAAWLLPGFVPVVPLSAVMSVALWVMSRSVGKAHWRPSRRTLAALALFPLFTIAAIAVNGSDGPLCRLARNPAAAWPTWVPRSLYLPYTAALVTMSIMTCVTLVRARRHSSRLQRRQAGALLLGMLVPLPGAVITVTLPQGTIPDLAPLSYVGTGLISGYAVLRYGLLRLVPVARGLVLDRLRDAVIVLSEDRRVIDVNLAAERLLRAVRPDLPPSIAGLRFEETLPAQLPARISSLGEGGDGEYEIELPTGRMTVDVHLEDLTDARGRRIGRVIVLRDITELFRLRENLAEQAVRDELTGLYNRRKLLAVLERELASADADRLDLCVVMMDIDHFKSVNDEHGHLVGDALLAATSRALTEAVRDGDVVARYGGEEFVVLLPGITIEQALARAEDLRRRCAAVAVDAASGTIGRTVSVGVVSVRSATARSDAGPMTPTTLLQAADRALYAAKDAGRNQVVAVA